MAQKSKKRSNKKRSRARNVTPPPRRRRDGKAALRGMLFGAGIFAVLAIIFFVRMGGDTPFNHVVNALTSDEDKKKSQAKETRKDQSKVKPARAGKASSKRVKTVKRPSGPKPTIKPRVVTTNAAKAPPLETTTVKDKNSLDTLIKSKSK